MGNKGLMGSKGLTVRQSDLIQFLYFDERLDPSR